MTLQRILTSWIHVEPIHCLCASQMIVQSLALVNQSSENVFSGIATEAKLPAPQFSPIGSLVRGGFGGDWFRSNGVSARHTHGRR